MALDTAFAPAERAPDDEVRRQHGKLAALPFVREFLDAVPNMSVVLNKQRQIVCANRAFVAFLGLADPEALLGRTSHEVLHGLPAGMLGRRPGEALKCIRSGLTTGGCGTTRFCANCGAVNAILNSQSRNTLDVQECRMLCRDERGEEATLDLRVWSHPIDVEGEGFTVFSLMDISDEKRRQALEKIFFHDVLNTAGGVKGLADLLVQPGESDVEFHEVAGMLAESADQLVSEIAAQRMLSAAESGELRVSPQRVEAMELLAQTTHQFHSLAIDLGIAIEIDEAAEQFSMVSDAVLLRRVLTNLVKNALEATARGGTVTIGSQAEGDSVWFTVHNPSVMSREVQTQVFMRSFTTKGMGRGLGTYSIKLLSEKYLAGRVSFVSLAPAGTRFTVCFPRELPAAVAAV